MSARDLQRVVVRMLHDAELLSAVYADARAALADVALSDAERAWLTAPDVRAWGVDAHRSDRVLAALLGELGIAALALLEDGVPLGRLHRFFQSAFFHRAIMQRRSLTAAFGDHLATLAKTPRARSFVALEAAIAALRRAPEPSAVPGTLTLSSRVAPLELAAGTLAAWDKARKRLAGEPIAAALVKAKRLKLDAVDAKATEWVLLEQRAAPEPDQGSLPPAGLRSPVAGFIGEALGRLLLAAESPVPREALIAIACGEGADADEAAEILDDLVRDALLL